MKFAHVYQAVHHAPWMITPAGHAAVAALLDKKIKAKELKSKAGSEPLTDFFGEPLPAMTIDPVSGLATIPIRGVMARGIGPIEKMCGACDTAEVISNIEEAEASELVTAILFEIDSPGGTVDGTAELGAAIATITKPNAGWILSLCASAAYWAAAQMTRLYGPLSCEVGSIGVLSAAYDASNLRAAAQIPDINVMRPSTAPLKAPGAYATPYTPAQIAQAQAQSDYLHQQFMSAVNAHRPEVLAESMQGQTFFGQQAVDAGLIDEICTRDYALGSLL